MTGGQVLILGEVGRNFAAGMSGGIAYVWDPLGKLPQRCNAGNVKLGKLNSRDASFVKAQIEKHFTLTGSERAKDLLVNFSEQRTKFVCVVPHDYQTALLALEQASKEGLNAGEQALRAYDAVVANKRKAG
jgi:glutamate synthase domain-containing protein 3